MKYLIVFISLLACSCGETLYQGSPDNGPQGPAGKDGSNGSSGQDGSNGLSVVASIVAATTLQCTNGGYVFFEGQDINNTGVFALNDLNIESAIICNGVDGASGVQGDVGPQGPKGNTGATGPAGSPAPQPLYTPVSTIEPCGAASSPWKEVLLCLSGGSVLSDFSETMSGQDTRLSFIPAGSYQDTDESGCNFNVAVDAHGDTTVSWSAGSNAYATWTANSVTCTAN